MRYIGDIYRPPSEAMSLLLQVTVGCSYNKCTFCSMYKEKQFKVRPISEILEDLSWARNAYRKVTKIFLCDGDAMCLINHKLITILDKVNELFPECTRVSTYARSIDILRKSEEELIELKNHGLSLCYIGAESGSDKVLKLINKGETSSEIIEAVNKLERIGIKTSVTFISGLAGEELKDEHAIETGKMIAKLNASYVSLLTLMLEEPAPIVREVLDGKFKLLTPREVLEEAKVILEYARPSKECVFRANHASNYVSLRGNLPDDNDRLIETLDYALNNESLIKDERFRAL